MLFRSLLLFAFTSLSIAVAVPNTNDDALRRAAAAACDNLCNRSDQNRSSCVQCVMNKITSSAAPCPAFDNRRQGQRGCGHVEQSSRGGLSGTPDPYSGNK
ncbi:hypothetical protein Vi05172_g5008 [Venturia inaequalis]|nr:hypothetical protein Vi05172_g5008 [Venturia inaequalis]